MAEEERVNAHNEYNRRLMKLAELRSKKFDEARKIIDQQREEVKAQAQAQLQRAQQAQAEDKKNWFDEAAQGASMGAVAGPWGALIGGIIGTGMGMAEAVGQRQSEGEGALSAIGNTIFDAPGFNFGEAASAGVQGENAWEAGREGGMKVDPMQAAQVGVMAYQGMGAGNAFEGKGQQGNWDPNEMNKKYGGGSPESTSGRQSRLAKQATSEGREIRAGREMDTLMEGARVPDSWQQELASKKADKREATSGELDYNWEK